MRSINFPARTAKESAQILLGSCPACHGAPPAGAPAPTNFRMIGNIAAFAPVLV